MDIFLQIGVSATIYDQSDGRCNNIYYASAKSKRVCKSASVAEVYAFLAGFDVGLETWYALEEYLGDRRNRTMYTDLRSSYGLCIQLASTTERHLLIDLAMNWEASESRYIFDIVWISGFTNPADDLTKMERRSGTPSKIMETNRSTPKVQSWVQRDTGPVQTMESWG